MMYLNSTQKITILPLYKGHLGTHTCFYAFKHVFKYIIRHNYLIYM